MAKIKDEDIEALRERADIVEVVSAHSQLKKAGTNKLKGLCPFHSEKTPSFTVDSSKNLWHCFGCGEGGDIYGFVQKSENLPFPDAVEWLAKKTGFDLRYEEMRPGEKQARGLKQRLVAANEAAIEFFQTALFETEDAAPARLYLENRGFGREVAQRWKLGYAPGRGALCKHLMTKGFSREEIEKSDLGRPSKRDGSLYDTFMERIIFPTWNHQGDPVGFGARALGDQQPKYLNTADTPLFSKSRVMYGLDRARGAVARGDSAIVVEGYTDVIALHEAGLDIAVATNGVALGESHFELLKKWTKRVVLMLDSDAAGQGATERSFEMQHKIGIEVLVAALPAGRDPADVVAEDGAEAITKALESARPLLEFKLEQTIAKLPLDTPEARARAVRETAVVLGWHPDPIARHEYAFMTAQRIGVDEGAVQRAISEAGQRRVEPGGGTTDKEYGRRLPGNVKVEREALQLLLTQVDGAREWAERITEADFTSNARRELFSRVREVIVAGDAIGPRVADGLAPEAAGLFTELALTEVDSNELGRTEEVFTRVQIFGLERQIKVRREALGGVNPLEDPAQHDGLFTELVGLEAARRDLLKHLAEDA